MHERTIRSSLAAVVTILAVTLATNAPGAPPESSPRRSAEQVRAAQDAHQGDFDYLLGDWEFTGVRGEQKFRGYWAAVRLEGGQILDEYRVVGDSGETLYATTTLRNYNAFADRWELVGAVAGGGLQDVGTAQRDGSEMRLEQRFGVASGKPSVWKIRYYGIEPDRFSWTADRSTDGGATWVTGFQRIEARRIGPSRFLERLTPSPKPAERTPDKQ